VILTITLNPSIDRTVSVPELRVGEVHVVTPVRDDPGGKGVNVTRALATQGFASTAVIVSGGVEAIWMTNAIKALGADAITIDIDGKMRTNIAVVDDKGQVTKLNEPGPVLTADVMAEVEAAIEDVPSNWVVLAGRLPRGVGEDAYVPLIKAARAAGARVAVDTEGAALLHAVAQGPDLIKPNIHELIGLVGRPLTTFGEVIDACQQLVGSGVGAVLCSLGPDGAFYFGDGDPIHVAPAQPVTGTPVGAGDVLLAGFLAHGANAEGLADAVRWSAASVRLPGTGVPTREQAAAESVSVSAPVDRERLIKEVA
jgi:1-phosphofructokinase